MTDNFVVLAQSAAQGTAAPARPAAVQTQPAAAPKQQPGFMDGIGGMLPIIIVFVAMFYLMHRSQAKERKRREEMLNAIKAGDRILTAGGIYGTIESVGTETYKIAIADNVRIEIAKSAVGSVIRDEAKVAEPAKK